MNVMAVVTFLRNGDAWPASMDETVARARFAPVASGGAGDIDGA